MSNLWKRVLSVILAIVMVIAGLPSMGIGIASVRADSTWDGYTWPPYDFGTTAGGWSRDSDNKVRFNIGSGSQGIAEESAQFITANGNRLWKKYESQYGHDTWWVDLTDAATIKTGQQKDLINYIAEVKDKMYFTLVNSGGWSPESAGWYSQIYSEINTTEAEGLEIKADKGWWRDAGWPYVDFSGDSSKKHATHVGAIMWVENNDGVNKLHINMYTTWVWEDGVWTGPAWTWDGVTTATATYHNSQGSQGELDFPWTGTPTSRMSGSDVVFEATADFETNANLYHFEASDDRPAHPTSSKTFGSSWNWNGIWAAATNTGAETTASAEFALKSSTGPISNVDTNEKHTVSATVAKTKDSATVARLSAETQSSFGPQKHQATKTFNLTWGDWSSDYSTISATFTNAADPGETYTVPNATVTQVGSKNRATVYFCGLEFTTDSDDLTSTYEENNWRWTAYNSVEDTYPAILTLDEYKGSSKTGDQVLVSPLPTYLTGASAPSNGYTYVKGSDQKTTMNAYAPYDGKNYTTSPTYTKVFEAPTWDWPSMTLANATFTSTGESQTRQASGSKIAYVKAPERQSNGSYLLTKKATVTFLKNDFESPAKEFTVTPTVTVIPPTPVITVTPGGPTPTSIPETSTVFTDNWIWDAYSEANDNIKATATIGEFVEDYSTTVPVFVTDIADADTANKSGNKDTANKTKNKTTGDISRSVFFQGQVQHNGKTFTSGEREFKLDGDPVWDGFEKCVFTFKEVGSYKSGQGETIILTDENPGASPLEFETDGQGNRIGTMKRTWTATVTLGGCDFTTENEENGIQINDGAVWAYTDYLEPVEQAGQNDKGYTASITVLENGKTEPIDMVSGLPVTATKNADSETILTPKEVGQVIKKDDEKLYFHSNVTGKDYEAMPETVEAPVWRWSTDNSKAWATFEQRWNGKKTKEFEATMKDSERVEDKVNKCYVWTRTATVIFCGNEFTSEYKLTSKIKENDDPSSASSEESGWTWGEYRPNDDNYTATIHIEKAWYKNGVLENSEKTDIADNDTRSPKSQDEGKVYFQGSVELDGFTLTSSERSFTLKSKVWNETDYAACTFSFEEDATSVLNDKIDRIATYPKGVAGEITYGELEDDDQNVGKLMRDAFAEVTFGGAKFTDKTKQHNIDPGLYLVEWGDLTYDSAKDKYTAEYVIKVRTTQKEIERNTVDAAAVVTGEKKTDLTASIPTTSAYYDKVDVADRTKTGTVSAPEWTWVNHASGRVYATFAEEWGNKKKIERTATVTPGTEYIPVEDGREMYYFTHLADVKFCQNPFDDEDIEEKPPTFDKIVTPTPTPVGFTPTPTPSVGPGTPTPMPEDQPSIITWTWDDYKENLNGKDTNGNNKGSFVEAKATLHDDQRGFFTRSYTADGKKTGTGGITITSPSTAINPATIKYTAEIEHTTSTGAKRTVQDALNFALPTWEWEGNTAATATFTESNGKEFGKTPTTKVSIYTDEVSHEPSLDTTTYIADAYFGERHYQDKKVVKTDYVVYLRWPSSWARTAFDVYCYVHDDAGHDNGTTKVNGKDVKGELMTMVTEKTTRFLNYPMAKGDLVDPVVEFYDASGNRLATPDVQYMENGNATDITELRMTETGDWIYYEATIETTATNNTWKKYIPEVNAHSLTVLESGIIGLNFKFELPERYAGSTGTLRFTVPTLASNGEQETRYSYSNADRSREGLFVFRRNVRAYRMGDAVHAEFSYTGNGKILDDFSVENYLTESIGRADKGIQKFVDLRNVLCTLNDYGSYSQTGLNGTSPYVAVSKIYNTPALPDKAELLGKLDKYKIQVLRDDLDAEYNIKLQCWEDIRINVYVKTPKASVENIVMTAKDDPEPNGTFAPTLSYSYINSSKEYRVTLTGIPLDALEKNATVRMTLDGKVIEFKVCALSAQQSQLSQGTYDVEGREESLKQALGVVNVWKELYKFFNKKDVL